MSSSPFAMVVRLQQSADGQLWYAETAQSPRILSDWSTYADGLLTGDIPVTFRMLGLAGNARLLCEIYRRLEGRPQHSLEVASPAVCLKPQELNDPRIAIYRMSQCLLNSAAGGWHQVTIADAATYRLLHMRQGACTAESIVAAFADHPLRTALQFVSSLNVRAAIYLVTQIVDPRWFANPNHPDRSSRLRSFLGLTPAIAADVCDGVGSSIRHHRCREAMRAWGYFENKIENMQSTPGAFLWKYLAANRHDGSRAVLRTTQKFIAYMIHVWRGQLVQALRPGLQVFDPSLLFDPVDLQAYEQFAKPVSV